ncbi:hypothetical protein FKW77_010814 [Venturia effusa]|uniref:Rhodopsin domain-containing protein n=1 Tax=Venturia effusa TaxID=50376 RepID=A0A517KYI5_9PEZI|nr:hypothetical protein FKW77_010814 [Venturia effusa]
MDSSFSAKELEENAKLAYTEVVIAAIFLVFTWIVIGLRFYVRSHLLHSIGYDDWFVFLTQIFFTVYCAIQMVIVHLVPGISPALEVLDVVTGWFIAGATQYAFAMITLKLSLGAFFLRIITSPGQRRIVYVVVVAATVANLTEIFYMIFMCGAPNDFARKIILDKCAPTWSIAFVAYGQNTVNTLTDIVLAVLPIPLLWKANMAKVQKWTVGLILTLATTGCISSIVRFVYIHGILHPKSIGFYKTIKPLTIICIVEVGSGILACSLATLRPFFSKFVNLSTIRQSISRVSHSLHNTKTGPESSTQEVLGKDVTSSRDSELYEVQRARTASAKESLLIDADSRVGVFPEEREKNGVISTEQQARRFDEGSEDDDLV